MPSSSHESGRPSETTNTRPSEENSKLPTLVSFFAGRQYYHDAAVRLKRDCERLGMPHDIVELDSEGLDWASICRLKIQFYAEMQRKHGAILWVDVDDRLLKLPDVLSGTAFDIVGFGGRFRYIRDYDPYQVTRFWVPSILYFGDTPAASEFIELMAALERESDQPVTDDWVLHEAWLKHKTQMNVGLLSPHLVARKQQDIGPETIILHGDSGSVGEYRTQVVQHEKRLDNAELRSSVLLAESRDLMKAKDRTRALILAERASIIAPASPAACLQYANYLAFTGKRPEGIETLVGYDAKYPGNAAIRESIVHHARVAGDQGNLDLYMDSLLASPDPAVRARAESTAYEVEFDKRAQALGIGTQDRLRMWWMKTPYPGNFGDILSPWIVEQVSGVPPIFGNRNSALLAIGSIIKFATPKSVVWGSGTPRVDDPLSAEARYLAVRGPLTREVVLANGGDCPPVYGDPGLLLPFYMSGRSAPTRDLGVIRHVNHRATPIEMHEDVLDINLRGVGTQFIQEVVSQITDCQAILTTSLHGLIIANAYGIPARLCHFSDAEAVTGDGTKYSDYFASVGLPDQNPLDLSGDLSIDPGWRRYVDQDVDLQYDPEPLMQALREYVSNRA